MSSAYPCWESRTPSVLKKTNVSLSEATAALATTKATVALSGSFFADVRLTPAFADKAKGIREGRQDRNLHRDSPMPSRPGDRAGAKRKTIARRASARAPAQTRPRGKSSTEAHS